MVTRCYLCGGKTVQRLVTAENWWGDQLTLVEGVPAWVCENCGEKYFEAEVCRILDAMREAPPAEERIMRVPVYKFPPARLAKTPSTRP
ncbi:YgiT-type zinc finger domain-containing protein [Thermanaeromonas toyohensis ToBE]|uniref:YgiT-type zinc finger domain-containing protein n=1 Tax=Thermanaeromonas toyohensis ToBE TaxID=698762 RepID=A0A1W1W0B4_9FIRM|nr:type II toxin-antitoxin system MqsA family antitoxin [Thermanaeromonas toyohensis]SMB99059.1 YgiT-type zinc finger domain-containing protein [Thermanaeromonas toyohensis ToBE]